jgi:hypothetical protein
MTAVFVTCTLRRAGAGSVHLTVGPFMYIEERRTPSTKTDKTATSILMHAGALAAMVGSCVVLLVAVLLFAVCWCCCVLGGLGGWGWGWGGAALC